MLVQLLPVTEPEDRSTDSTYHLSSVANLAGPDSLDHSLS